MRELIARAPRVVLALLGAAALGVGWACSGATEPAFTKTGTAISMQMAISVSQQTGGPAFTVRLQGLYKRADGVTATLADRTVPLGAGAQQIPLSVDLGPCLTDPGRPQGTDCSITVLATLLRDGVAVDQFVIGPLTVKPGVTTTVPNQVSLFEINSVAVTPTSASLVIASTQQLTAVATGPSGPVPRTPTWSSSAPSVATVSSSGLVTAVAAGTATITANFGASSATAAITVTAAPALAVAPATVAFTGVVGGNLPASQTVAVTNASGGPLTGLALGTISYGTGATGWLTATLSGPATPATVTLVPNTASLAAGTYTATVPVTGSAANSPQNITVTYTVTQAPTIALSGATAAASALVGGANPGAQTITITNAGTGILNGLALGAITYGAGATGWLTATLNQATAPATLSLQAATGSLAAGTYTATIPVTSSATGVSNSPQNVTFTFTVSAAPAPTIALTANAVTFSASVGAGNPANQTVTITNSGTGTLNGLAVGTIAYGAGAAGWLTATLNQASAPATLTLAATTGSLAAGTYTATVPITSSASGVTNSPQNITVTFTVANGAQISLASTSATFSASQGGASPASQTIAVSNSGTGSLTGLAVGTISYGTGASGWLTATLNQATAPATLTLTAATGSLAIGTYTATVPITSPVAVNSPQSVTVTFTVASGAVIGLTPASLTFSATQGGGNPANQTVAVANAGTGALNVALGTIVYGTGASGWLTATLNQAAAPATVTLSATTGALAPGSYTATIPVTSASASNSPLNITVTFTVAAPIKPVFVPSSASFTSVAFGANPTPLVDTVKSSGAPLGGLTATVNYGAGASGWLTATLGGTTTPTTLTLSPATVELPTGTYTASVVVSSTTSGSAVDSLPVSFTITPQPAIALSIPRLGDVSVGRTNTLNITLGQAAPAGGLVVTLSNGTPAALTLGAGTVTIPQGATAGSVTITGAAAGSSLVTASAPGYISASTTVASVVRSIGAPTSQRVPYTQTAQLPINLNPAVPTGKSVTLSATTSQAGLVGINPSPGASITLTAGQNTANFVLNGVLPGTSTITVSDPDYGTVTVPANTSAIVDFLQTSLSFPATFTTTARIDFRATAGGTVIAAPPGGIAVSFVSRAPACVAAPANQTIPAGQVSLNPDVTITYGGTATTPCSTYLVATATNIDPDSVLVSVGAPPSQSLNGFGGGALGRGLQDQLSGFLSTAAPVGGVTIRLKSQNPGFLRLSPNATTAGTDSIDVFVAVGGSSYSYYVQAADSAVPGTSYGLSATELSSRYTSASLSIPVRERAAVLYSLSTTLSTLGADGTFLAAIGTVNSNSSAISNYQSVRAGGIPITMTFTTSNAGIATLVSPPTPGTTGASGTYVFQPGATYISPNGIANGGIAIRPVSAGTVTVSVSIPGGAVISGLNAQAQNVTVSAPTISMNGFGGGALGRGLQDGLSGFLSTAVPAGGATFRLTSQDPGRILLAPDATTPGSATLDIPLTAGASSFSYYVQALDTVTAGVSANITVIELLGRYTPPSPLAIPIRQRAARLYSVPTTISTLGSDASFLAAIGVANSVGSDVSNYQSVRAGGSPITMTFASSTPGAATLALPTGGTSATGTFTFQPSATYISPSGVASGGVAIRPVSGGSTTLSVSIPGGATLTNANTQSQTLTVSAPTISLNGFGGGGLGRGLQDQLSGFLSSAVPAGGAVIRITSNDPARILIAPDATTPGSALLDINLAAGQSSFSYYVQALDTVSAGVVASIGAIETLGRYTPSAPLSITLRNRAVQLYSYATTQTTLQGADSPVSVGLGAANSASSAISNYQSVRAGGTAVPVTIATSAPGVSTLVAPPSPGTATASATYNFLPAGANISPSGLAQGGPVLRPLAPGTTTLSASIPGGATLTGQNTQSVTVTVSAPAITLGTAFYGIGAGLQENYSFFLGAPSPAGSSITLVSSDSSVLVLSASPTVAGTGTLVIPLGTGNTSGSFYAQALDNARGNIAVTASVPGYSSGITNYNVVQPAAQMTVPTTASVTASLSYFYVQTGIANVQQTGLNTVQSRRAGGAPLTATVTNGSPTVASFRIAGVPGTSGTLSIAPGVYYTPLSTTTGFAFQPLTTGSVNWSFTMGSSDFLRIPAPNGDVITTVQ